jgi:hypothetical protein
MFLSFLGKTYRVLTIIAEVLIAHFVLFVMMEQAKVEPEIISTTYSILFDVMLSIEVLNIIFALLKTKRTVILQFFKGLSVLLLNVLSVVSAETQIALYMVNNDIYKYTLILPPVLGIVMVLTIILFDILDRVCM